MSNLSDKDIDRLSREAADLYEPDHSSLSWTKLEQKLIEQIPERPPDGFRFGRINPYLWGSAIILITGISFFTIKNIYYSQHSTRTSQPIVQKVSSSSSDNKLPKVNTIHLDRVSSVADAGVVQGSVVGKNSGTGNGTNAARSTNAKNHNSNIAGSKRNPGENSSETKHSRLIASDASGR